jgi:hypothetical protein
MAMHTDIPTRRQIERLLERRSAVSVSIYLPTHRVTQDAQKDRIELKDLGRTAADELLAGGADPDDVAGVTEGITHLVEDDEFWVRQANSLAVFATPEGVSTFRLPNHLTTTVVVADRFFVKPLFRSVTFPQAAHVLALSQGGVRLLEIGPDGDPEEVHVPGLPDDAWGSGGNKVHKARERNYVRQVDHALRGFLSGSELPLILAASQPMAAHFRSVTAYPHVAEERIHDNPETATDAELATAARTVLDGIYAGQLAATRDLLDLRSSQGRAATDVADVARLATIGAVDTVLVDIDEHLPGRIDEETGAVSFGEESALADYGVIDEIARRVHLAGGTVLAVRRDDIPGGGPVAAILRYAAGAPATS